MLTSPAEYPLYEVLRRSDGLCHLVLTSDWKAAQNQQVSAASHIDLRSIDGFVLRIVKMYDGTIYVPNCCYRGEERREGQYLEAQHV